MSYLKTVRGPLNQLQFLLAAQDWQERLHDLHLEHLSETNKGTDHVEGTDEDSLGRNRKEELSHLHWEAWELFKNYFHEGWWS